MKRILLAGAVLLAMNASFAQQPHVEFGLKGGVNIPISKMKATAILIQRLVFMPVVWHIFT
jgi:hypothetical protein